MKEVRCIGYIKTYRFLTLDIFKNGRKTYEILKIRALLAEYSRGFYSHKINKATKNGTSIKFKPVTEENVQEKLQEIKDYAEEINKEFGFGFVIK
jgi:hypothetical protein